MKYICIGLIWGGMALTLPGFSATSLSVSGGGNLGRNINLGFQDRTALSLKIRSDDPDGFFVSITSRNQGRFIRQDTQGLSEHNHLPYTFRIEQTGWRWHYVSDEIDGEFDLGVENPAVFQFDIPAPNQRRTNGTLRIKMDVLPKTLWYGAFYDILTVTLAGL